MWTWRLSWENSLRNKKGDIRLKRWAGVPLLKFLFIKKNNNNDNNNNWETGTGKLSWWLQKDCKTGLKSKLNWRGDEVQVGRWVENLRWGEWGKEAQEQKRKEQTGWRNIGNSRTNEGDAGQMWSGNKKRKRMKTGTNSQQKFRKHNTVRTLTWMLN